MAYSEKFTSVRIKNNHQDPVLNVKKKICTFFHHSSLQRESMYLCG